MKFTLDADDADGKPMNFTYGGALDGTDVPLPSRQHALALTRISDTEIESVLKRNGVVVDRWTRVLHRMASR